MPPIPQTAAPVAPAYPPAPVRARLHGLRLFRPRLAVPVPAQIVIVPPAYPPKGVRARLKGLKLFRPRIAEPTPDQQSTPIPPVPPVTAPAPNGWYGLLGIVKDARIIKADAVRRDILPISCPNDGEILSRSRDGILFCKYDGYVPEGQSMPATRNVGGGEWGNLRSVIEMTKSDGRQDRKRRNLACPHDGEPYSRSIDGILYCRWDGYIPPQRPDGS